jgi:hypothetical protein
MVVWRPNDLEPYHGAVVTGEIGPGDVAVTTGHQDHGERAARGQQTRQKPLASDALIDMARYADDGIAPLV